MDTGGGRKEGSVCFHRDYSRGSGDEYGDGKQGSWQMGKEAARDTESIMVCSTVGRVDIAAMATAEIIEAYTAGGRIWERGVYSHI